jgi:L-threonylcarbamoyladenylate synthase
MTKRAGIGAGPHAVEQAVKVLHHSGVVAFPTETYYGLAVDPTDALALARLFALKQRPESKPLLLLIDQLDQLMEVVREIPKEYRRLIEMYWPGPLTLIFPARPEVNVLVTGGTGTVGVRISPHPIARELVRRVGRPVTATSANISSRSPAASAEEVIAQFGEKLDWIIDGGPATGGLCSTVCTLEGGKLVVLRRGQVVLPSALLE